LLKMFKRDYIKKPYASITTDEGSEFMKEFAKYMFDESIYHKTTRPGRHKQLGNIDNLIKQISSLLVGLANKKELETGKISKQWVKHLPLIREKLNEIRKKKLPDDYTRFDYPAIRTIQDNKLGKPIKQVFNVNDMVHVQ
jgi:hypothetical protein